MRRQLTILFTNIWLSNYGGSEVVVRDLAVGSMRRGHRPIVYTPELGDVAQELRGKGVAVIDDLRMVAEAPDIIHAHHLIPCAEALIRFPSVPAINVCHAFDHWVEAPLHFPQVGAYVAADEACRDRLVHTEGIDPARVLVLPNAVDLRRVPPRHRPLAERPRRALALGKAAGVAQIRSACEALSIDLEEIGYSVGRVTANPEDELVKFDLVFASARCALEALCCGCAVIVCDSRGIAGLVTSENFSMLRDRNFGLRSLVAPIRAEPLIENVERYDRNDAAVVCQRARREADLERLLDDFDTLYAEILTGARRPAIPQGGHEAAVAQFLHDFLPRRPSDSRWPGLRQQEALRRRSQQLEKELADAAQAQDVLHGRNQQLERELTDAAQARDLLHERNQQLEKGLADAAQAQDVLHERNQQLENQLTDVTRELEQRRAEVGKAAALTQTAQMRYAETHAQLAFASNELAMLKRSRLLKFGRWLRRIRGLPVPY